MHKATFLANVIGNNGSRSFFFFFFLTRCYTSSVQMQRGINGLLSDTLVSPGSILSLTHSVL